MNRTYYLFRLLLTIAAISGISADHSTPTILAHDHHSASGAETDSISRLLVQDVTLHRDTGVAGSTPYPLHPGFPINIGYWVEKAPVTIADINNDGSNELLVQTWNSGTPYPGKIYAWNASGSLLPGYPINSEGHMRGRLALGDLDHDGKLEIVAGVESFSEGIGGRVFVWRSDGTPYPGWPQNTACYRADEYCGIASIILADLDKDSNLEVIAGTDNRDITTGDPTLYVPNLYVWRNNGQLADGNWPVEDDHNVAIVGAMAVGDLEGDGAYDIVTGRDYNRLFAYDNQGNNLPGWPVYVFWPYDTSGWPADEIAFARSAVTLADLDGDGLLEYIVNGLRSHFDTGIDYATDLLVYAKDGQRWRGWSLPATGEGLLSQITWRMLEAPAIGDLNGDHSPDIVVATQDGWVRAYTQAKQLLWSFDYAQGRTVYATETAIGDVDGDGWNEVLFGTFDIDFGNPGPFGVWILEHNGAVKFGEPLVVQVPGVTSPPTLGDVDLDGQIEIAAVTWTGKLYVWDAPGQALPGRLPWPMARHDLQRTALFVSTESDLTRSAKVASTYAPRYGDMVTYTLQLIRTGAPLTSSVQLTDVIPLGLSYVSESLTATVGLPSDSLAPMLRWTGLLSDTTRVTVTYVTTVTALLPAALTNSAVIEVGATTQLTRSVTLVVNGRDVYLPMVYR